MGFSSVLALSNRNRLRLCFANKVSLLLLLGLWVTPVLAHDWAELNSAELTSQRLEQLISIAEKEQASLDAKLEPLASNAAALGWLEWLQNALLLYTYEGQTAFEQRLMAANYQLEEEDLLLFWQHEMAQLVQVYDASFTGSDQEVLSKELESINLKDNPELYARASQLSYQLSLSGVSEADKRLLEPFLPRLSKLIEDARGQR